MRRLRSIGGLAAILLCAAACSGGGGPAADVKPDAAPRANLVPPQVLVQAQPDLSDAEAEALWSTPGKVRVILAVNVGRDGLASNVRIVAAEPRDQAVSRAFAEAVVRSIPRWKFQPATRSGVPVDAEMNLAMEAEGGGEEQAPR